MLTVSAATVLFGVFAPWLRSGSSRRSSFDLLDLAERLGFADDGVFALAVRLWPLVPLVVVGSVVAFWSRRDAFAAGLALLGSCYVAAVAAAVWLTPDATLVHAEWGVTASFVGAMLLFAAGATELLVTWARSRAARTRP